MSKVTVTLNGREFTIGCEDGQEAYLRELAGQLDARVGGIVEQVGQIGDVRLLLMAALMLIDEHKETERRIEALENHIERLRHERHGAASLQAEERQRMVSCLIDVAERLEAFAADLEGEPPAGPGEEDGTPAAHLADARA
ncbi:MAG: cell division protein ZapA [Maricaulis sp.]|uniref:Cell division protein ZapA n=1 Tax=Maricaulis virginensis TaxID=144022 RepID=A0A9W6IMZ9_9PROT|nr:cell division protein ZapA [Maricaulis virginensis]MAC38820.1 cell division protein ZapA [Oceanicaulis sp.]MAZ90757.1 cell division protein ZapA [Maricaulis sp.]GLK51921.1 cell division protein ZapA [Maricaulis virginensis]